jgi:hypothetical protein
MNMNLKILRRPAADIPNQTYLRKEIHGAVRQRGLDAYGLNAKVNECHCSANLLGLS